MTADVEDKQDNWNFLVGFYFCFITLSTIGFGDYVPGTSLDTWAAQEKLILCALYLIIGLALLAMCFELIQEEVRLFVRSVGIRIGLVNAEEASRNWMIGGLRRRRLQLTWRTQRADNTSTEGISCSTTLSSICKFTLTIQYRPMHAIGEQNRTCLHKCTEGQFERCNVP